MDYHNNKIIILNNNNFIHKDNLMEMNMVKVMVKVMDKVKEIVIIEINLWV